MARKSKCHECNIIDDAPKIIDEDNVNKRYHATCLDVAMKKKEFLKKEKEQKDELFYKLLEVHGLRNTQEIPPLFYMKVEEIRNDSGLLGRYNKRYKQGVPYNAISATYDYCAERIEYALKTIEFDTKLGEMKYCLAIVQNNVVDCYNAAVQKMKQKEIVQRQIDQKTDADKSINEINKNNKTDNMDISALL